MSFFKERYGATHHREIRGIDGRGRPVRWSYRIRGQGRVRSVCAKNALANATSRELLTLPHKRVETQPRQCEG